MLPPEESSITYDDDGQMVHEDFVVEEDPTPEHPKAFRTEPVVPARAAPPAPAAASTMQERMDADRKLQAILNDPAHPYKNTAAAPDLRMAAALEVGRLHHLLKTLAPEGELIAGTPFRTPAPVEPHDIHDLQLPPDEPLPYTLPALDGEQWDAAMVSAVHEVAQQHGLESMVPGLLERIAYSQHVGRQWTREECERELATYGERGAQYLKDANEAFAALPQAAQKFLQSRYDIGNDPRFIIELGTAWQRRTVKT
jgi:hypothetical protein